MNTRVACSNPTCAAALVVPVTGSLERPGDWKARLERAGWRLEVHDDDVTPSWYCSRCTD